MNTQTKVQKLTKAFSDAIPLGPHPNPYQEFIPVRLDFVQEAISELQRLQLHEQANKKWLDKTDWLLGSRQPNELGMHRADGLKQRIENLQASNAALEAELKNARAEIKQLLDSKDMTPEEDGKCPSVTYQVYAPGVWHNYTPGVTPVPAPTQQICYALRGSSREDTPWPDRAGNLLWDERGKDTIASFCVVEKLDELLLD